MGYRRCPPCSRILIILRLFCRSPLRLHIQSSPFHIASSPGYPLLLCCDYCPQDHWNTAERCCSCEILWRQWYTHHQVYPTTQESKLNISELFNTINHEPATSLVRSQVQAATYQIYPKRQMSVFVVCDVQNKRFRQAAIEVEKPLAWREEFLGTITKV